MSELRILIVEDDLSFALDLEILLHELGYTSFSRTDNSAEALDHIFSQKPDIIFMDINIGGRLTGIDVGKAVAHLHIPVFYMTALVDPTYEMETRSALTFGYLRKPVEKHTLTEALNDALSRAVSFSQNKLQTENILPDFFFVKKNEVFHKVLHSDILFAESIENYCKIVSKDEKFWMLRMPMQEILTRLSPDHFLQVHRRFIVRKECIDQVNLKSGNISVKGNELPVSKSHKAKIRDILGRDEP
jgi:DNA-binding LytR/AlgR family response regulator